MPRKGKNGPQPPRPLRPLCPPSPQPLISPPGPTRRGTTLARGTCACSTVRRRAARASSRASRRCSRARPCSHLVDGCTWGVGEGWRVPQRVPLSPRPHPRRKASA
eukprot:scaffold9279_cov26-Tisochrysis_lutea.AAC.2